MGAVTVGYMAAPGPLLSTPLLVDTAAEAVDARTVKFLGEELSSLRAVPYDRHSSEQQARITALLKSKRTRMKSRKKKTPKTSSSRSSGVRIRRCGHGCARRPRQCGGGCARRRPWQWHVRGWFCRCFSPRVVMSVVVKPKMLGITAGMNQKDCHEVTLVLRCPCHAGRAGFSGSGCETVVLPLL